MSEVLVIMPFGQRSFVRGSTIVLTDFDALYMQVIQPAVARGGNRALRVDDVIDSGNIASIYINKIVEADLLIADLTMPNGNVFYELGIRQSLSNRPTILIAQADSELPFDVRNQKVLLYRWSTDLEKNEAINTLARWIAEIPSRAYTNPVHQYLKTSGFAADPSDALSFERDMRGKIERANTLEQLNAVWSWAKAFKPLPSFALLSLAEKFALKKSWEDAAAVARVALDARSLDYEIHRKLGWYLRNAGEEHYDEAEREFRVALSLNAGDLEALGMLGGLLKRRGRYSEAAELYGRGVKESPQNLYLRVAHAGLKLLADPRPESTALELYRDVLERCRAPKAAGEPWAFAAAGEASFVLGDDAGASTSYLEARRLAADPTVLTSPADQLALFAKAGFRPDEALSLEAILRDYGRHVIEEVVSQAPSIAARNPSQASPIIVHLSDPHFGYRVGSDGKKIEMHRFFDGDWSLTLEQHMLNELASKSGRFRAEAERLFVVISGDIVYQGGADEYKQALIFCNALVAGLPIPRERIIFCPGNHDVSWADAKVDRAKRFDNYLSFLNEFYGDTSFRKMYPYVLWDFKVNSARPDPTDLVGVARLTEHNIEIYSLNSCVYETEQQHYGFVSGKQLRKIEPYLNATAEHRYIRIAVLHHHIHPYPEPVALDTLGAHAYDASTIRDAGLLERFLEKHRFDVVLHGHKHKPQLRETRVEDANFGAASPKSLIVCGAGSCGVNARELEHAIPNQYQVIEILSPTRITRSEFLRVEWRELAVSPDAEWTTRQVWTLQG